MNGIDIEGGKKRRKEIACKKSRQNIQSRYVRGNNTTSRERRVIFFDGGLSCFRQPFSQIISALFPSFSSSKMSGRVVSAHTFQSGKKKKKENDGANLFGWLIWLEDFLQMKTRRRRGRSQSSVDYQTTIKKGEDTNMMIIVAHSPFSSLFSF